MTKLLLLTFQRGGTRVKSPPSQLEPDTELDTSRSRDRKEGRLGAKSWGQEARPGHCCQPVRGPTQRFYLSGQKCLVKQRERYLLTSPSVWRRI